MNQKDPTNIEKADLVKAQRLQFLNSLYSLVESASYKAHMGAWLTEFKEQTVSRLVNCGIDNPNLPDLLADLRSVNRIQQRIESMLRERKKLLSQQKI